MANAIRLRFSAPSKRKGRKRSADAPVIHLTRKDGRGAASRGSGRLGASAAHPGLPERGVVAISAGPAPPGRGRVRR